MIRRFKVAEHIFALSMPDAHPLWALLAQYEPFAIDGAAAPVDTEPESCSNGLFYLEVVDDLGTLEPELVFDQPTEPGETKIAIWRSGSDWLATMSPDEHIPVCGWLQMTPDYRRGRLKIAPEALAQRGSLALFALNNSLMLQFAFASAKMQTLEMHASVIKNGGKGYLFVAKSGTGKSTHSQLWLDNIPGSELLNDDNPIVRAFPDGTVKVFGSPWSGKTPCYKNDSCPAGAIVLIRRCSENKITRFDLFESYATVYSSSSGFKADSDMADGLHDALEKVVSAVPCFVLDCRPDPEAAFVCSKGVFEVSNSF